MNFFGTAPTEQELVAEVRRRRARRVSGRFEFRLTGADPAGVSKHLAGSAARARSGYMTGQFHQGTADVIDVLERIAAAAAGPGPVVSVDLDQQDAGRVRGVLAASTGRADDTDIRNAVDAVRRSWEQFSRYRPEAEAAEQARPPRVAADSGGWVD